MHSTCFISTGSDWDWSGVECSGVAFRCCCCCLGQLTVLAGCLFGTRAKPVEIACCKHFLFFFFFIFLHFMKQRSSPRTLIEYAIYAAICKRKWLLPRIIIVHHERGELRS